jgi:hypothetical protein
VRHRITRAHRKIFSALDSNHASTNYACYDEIGVACPIDAFEFKVVGIRRTAESYWCRLIVIPPAYPRAPGPSTIDNANVGRGNRESKTSQSGGVIEQGLEEGAFKRREGWGYLRRTSISVFLIGVYGDMMMCGTSTWSLGQCYLRPQETVLTLIKDSRGKRSLAPVFIGHIVDCFSREDERIGSLQWIHGSSDDFILARASLCMVHL